MQYPHVREHAENEGCYGCCEACNYDRHRCGGCGTPISHSANICDDCKKLYAESREY